MDVAALVVAILAMAAAGASALIAKGANTRADTANARAREALDLQKRIDDREREFRDVRWRGSVERHHGDGPDEFRLANEGLTQAESVVLVIEYSDRPREDYHLGTVGAGEWKGVRSEGLAGWMSAVVVSMPVYPGFTVHWSSPLGQVQEEFHGERQIFKGPAVEFSE